MLDCIDMPEADTPYPSPPKTRPYLQEVTTAARPLAHRLHRRNAERQADRSRNRAPPCATPPRSSRALGHHVEERGLGINYRKLYAASRAVLGANFAAAMRERVQANGPRADARTSSSR